MTCALFPGPAYSTETEPGKMLARYTAGLPSHGLLILFLRYPFSVSFWLLLCLIHDPSLARILNRCKRKRERELIIHMNIYLYNENGNGILNTLVILLFDTNDSMALQTNASNMQGVSYLSRIVRLVLAECLTFHFPTPLYNHNTTASHLVTCTAPTEHQTLD